MTDSGVPRFVRTVRPRNLYLPFHNHFFNTSVCIVSKSGVRAIESQVKRVWQNFLAYIQHRWAEFFAKVRLASSRFIFFIAFLIFVGRVGLEIYALISGAVAFQVIGLNWEPLLSDISASLRRFSGSFTACLLYVGFPNVPVNRRLTGLHSIYLESPVMAISPIFEAWDLVSRGHRLFGMASLKNQIWFFSYTFRIILALYLFEGRLVVKNRSILSEF